MLLLGAFLSGVFRRSLCNKHVNSFQLDYCISFIACEPLAAELLLWAVTARQWMRGERFTAPSLSHPLSSYSNYNELSSSPSKWKLQFPKMRWKAADQEANRRQWVNLIRKWFGKNLMVIVCCNARQSEERIQHSCHLFTIARLWRSRKEEEKNKSRNVLQACLLVSPNAAAYLRKAMTARPKWGPQYSSADSLGNSRVREVCDSCDMTCLCVHSVL